jgi:hypothetical protein
MDDGNKKGLIRVGFINTILLGLLFAYHLFESVSQSNTWAMIMLLGALGSCIFDIRKFSRELFT